MTVEHREPERIAGRQRRDGSAPVVDCQRVDDRRRIGCDGFCREAHELRAPGAARRGEQQGQVRMKARARARQLANRARLDEERRTVKLLERLPAVRRGLGIEQAHGVA